MCSRLASVCLLVEPLFVFFFFKQTPAAEIYTLSLHDALPICSGTPISCGGWLSAPPTCYFWRATCFEDNATDIASGRSEEHTSELQSHHDLVCRLLLEKKKTTKMYP